MKTETINIKRIWEIFDFPYKKPEELSEQESVLVTVKNQSYENDWSLPEYIHGWIVLEAWFDNMVEGQPGRRGATRLQWRPDMGLPLYLDGYNNGNHGASLWFIPKLAIGGESPWQIRVELEFSDRGQPAFARLFAEKKN